MFHKVRWLLLLVFALLGCTFQPPPPSIPYAVSASTPAKSGAPPVVPPAVSRAQVTPAAGAFPGKSEAEPPPVNLVAAENGGRIVSVTDEHPKYPAVNLIDEFKYDYGEWWTNEPPQLPQVIVLALAHEQVKTINRVVLNAWTSEWRYGWVKDFEIYVSETSSNLKDMQFVDEFEYAHVGIDQEFEFDPVRARFIALKITSHYGSEEGITLNEIEVYEAPPGARPSEPGNIAAAKNGGEIAGYSSEDSTGDWPVERLIDGKKDTETGWSSSADLKTMQYVVVSFEDERLMVIDHVVLNPYSAEYPEDWIRDFELLVSEIETDPAKMTRLGRFRLAQEGIDQTFSFAPTRARYIALVPLTNYGGTAFALNEFEVYRVKPAATPAVTFAPRAIVPGANGPALKSLAPRAWPAEVAPQWAQGLRHPAKPNASAVDEIQVEVSSMDVLPSVYHLYGDYFDDLVMAKITNRNSSPARLRVEANLPNYTETAVQTLTLEAGETRNVYLDPPLLPGVLERLNEAKQAGLHVQVDYLLEGQKRLVYEDTATLRIWAQGDVLLGAPGFHNAYLFHATLVMPNDPSLDPVLRDAADYVDGSLTWGYDDETDSNGEVYAKLKAIYQAVADLGVTYVASGIPFVPREQAEEGFYLQRTKLPYQVIQTRSGLCVELAVLFAALYEKILLDPVLIHIPGHVFVAVPIAEDSSTYYVVETTMVGSASFADAISVGADEFKEALPEIAKDRLDDYFWLNISEVRQEGILPIPWR